jgi:hypothetical protein
MAGIAHLGADAVALRGVLSEIARDYAFTWVRTESNAVSAPD